MFFSAGSRLLLHSAQSYRCTFSLVCMIQLAAVNSKRCTTTAGITQINILRTVQYIYKGSRALQWQPAWYA